MTVRFEDRRAAGRVLAERLLAAADEPDVIVLALPRGGVPVAYEVATRLHAPLDVFVVRKIGLPWQPELAMGAVARGTVLVDRGLVERAGVSDEQLDDAVDAAEAELERREATYRRDRPALDVHGKTVIVVDDGLATGSTMRAALLALRDLGAVRVVAAVPVGAPEACAAIAEVADDVVCVSQPPRFRAVGEWYDDFRQTSDDEVEQLLRAGPTDRRP